MVAQRPAGNFDASGTWKDHGRMLLSHLLIATSFPVGAAITEGLDPAMLTLLRFTLAALLFAPYVAIRHGLTLPPLKSLAGYSVISGVLVFFFWAMFEALRDTSALNTGALFTLVPGIAAAYGVVLVRERIDRRRMIALFFGLVGALWVVFRGDPDRLVSLAFNRGDVLFLIACVVMALYMPLVNRFHRDEPTAVMTFWIMATGAVWLLLVNNTAVWNTDWGQVDFNVFLGIAYLAVFTTIFTFFLQQHGTLRIGPTRATSYNYLNPALVVGLEWIVGHGLPPFMALPGVAIVLLATVVLQLGVKEKRADQPPSAI